MKVFFKIVLGLLVVVIIIVLYKTLTFRSKSYPLVRHKTNFEVDPNVLKKAIQFETISHKPEMIDDSAFTGLHRHIESSFSLVDSLLEKEKINQYSLLYTWQGTDKSKQPLVLMAHMDVVPAEYATLNEWDYPPFSGAIEEGYIYGRGTIDDKGCLMAILHAAELLLEEGYKPERTIIFSFGHDEEIGGEYGAETIAKKLEERGAKASMVLDEGGVLSYGIVPGLERPVALVGTSEKGYMSLELSVNIAGGHSSMPAPQTAISALNKALYRLNDKPMPNRISPPLQGFVNHVGPELPFLQKMAFANTWLFKPLIFSVYRQTASGAALIHTTQVPTIFQSGVKDNVIPQRAKAVVNYRLLPGDEPDEIISRALKIIDDTLVKVRVLNDLSIPASPVSDYRSEEFKKLSGIIRVIDSNVIVSPYLVIGATDGRFFYNISDKVYRFSPIPFYEEDLPRIHGINERISVEAFKKSVNFYATLMKEF